jgi:hypothetical protein
VRPYANRRGKELLVRGYIDASELWRQIAAAIEDLQCGRREGELLNQLVKPR